MQKKRAHRAGTHTQEPKREVSSGWLYAAAGFTQRPARVRALSHKAAIAARGSFCTAPLQDPALETIYKLEITVVFGYIHFQMHNGLFCDALCHPLQSSNWPNPRQAVFQARGREWITRTVGLVHGAKVEH